MRNFKKLLLVVVIITMSACSTTASKRDVASDATTERIETFQRLVEEVMIWRSEAVKLVGTLDEKTRNKQVLTGGDIAQLLNSLEKYSDFYDQVSAEIKEDKNFITKSKLKKVVLSSEEGQEYLYHSKRLAAGEMLLYDNYLYVVYPLNKNTKLRRLINWDNERVDDKLSKIGTEVNGQDNRKLLSQLISFHSKEKQLRADKQVEYVGALVQEVGYFDQVIDQSMTIDYLKKTGTRIGDDWGGLFRAISDVVHEASSFVTYLTSKLFGNSVGMVEMRKGKLIKMSPEEQAQVISELQPLDLLLERTPFRLTSKFIPGYYGHVAVWVGTEEQLKELGVWDHPSVKPYQQAVRDGRRIIEALRSGVEINTFEHFLNIDDLLAMRIKSPLTLEQKRSYLIMAFEQLGKEYDFNFDVETEDRIVCSELAYVVYQDTDWQTERMLGRATISPDNVAVDGTPGGRFDVVVLYKDGERYKENLSELLWSMLESTKKKKVERTDNPMNEDIDGYRPLGRDR